MLQHSRGLVHALFGYKPLVPPPGQGKSHFQNSASWREDRQTKTGGSPKSKKEFSFILSSQFCTFTPSITFS